MTKKLKVAVLMGGKSSEREVSLASGREVIKNLDKNKFDVNPLEIPRNGIDWFDKLLRTKPDVVFIALHGPFGEDGTIQGMLEYAGILYTGPGILTSSVGMDKLMFRKVMLAEGVIIPKFVTVKKGEDFRAKLKNFQPPYFIKPNNQGSSVGASMALNMEDLETSLELAFKYDDIALIDEYIKGKELTCGILGNDKLEVLPLVEIVPKKGEFFDYESKYSTGGSDEISPARISGELTKRIQDIAVRVYKSVNAKGFSRIDFILKDNKPYVLEINTIPGLTSASLLPKAAKAAGLSFSELIEKIISYARK